MNSTIEIGLYVLLFFFCIGIFIGFIICLRIWRKKLEMWFCEKAKQKVISYLTSENSNLRENINNYLSLCSAEITPINILTQSDACEILISKYKKELNSTGTVLTIISCSISTLAVYVALMGKHVTDFLNINDMVLFFILILSILVCLFAILLVNNWNKNIIYYCEIFQRYSNRINHNI